MTTKHCIECKDKPVCANSEHFCKECAEEYYRDIELSPWF